MNAPTPDKGDSATDRLRSMVLNGGIAVAGGMALSGFLLRDREPLASAYSAQSLKFSFHAALIGLVLASLFLKRTLANPRTLARLDRPLERYQARLRVLLTLGFLAMALGLPYGLLVDPTWTGITPFWIVALGLTAICWPRRGDLLELESGLRSDWKGVSNS